MEMKQICSFMARFRGRLHHGCMQRRFCSSVAADHVNDQEIVIPPRIERGPTDILRALSGTLSTDFTAPHYKYHDDPYLIPSSNIGKRTFSLAKESGRKAAQWVQQQHPDLFQANIAEPPIPALMPRAIFGEDSPVSEEDLMMAVGAARVGDALKVLELLEKQGQSVSVSSLQSLLQLLCFYNAEDSVPEDLLEERWFRQGQRRERQRKTWRDGGEAERVFGLLQSKLEGQEGAQQELLKAKCALIKGMAKFCQVDRAWEMFQSLRAADEQVDAGCYEALIRAASFLRDGNEARWQLVEEVLRDMASAKVRPDLGTLNATLEALSTTGGWRQARTLALRALAEFKQQGVVPSLASYYFLLSIFCRERGPVSSILEEIISELESYGPLEMRDPKDTFFFVTGMDVCRNHLGDPALARRLHALLHAHNNYDLLGDSYKESIYYRHLFVTLCTLEPLDSFMELYNKYVPNIYIPEPSVMEEVVRATELHEAWSQLPRLWTDIMVFDQADRESLVTNWLSAAVTANIHSSLANQKASSSTTNESTGPAALTNLSEDTANDDLAAALCSSAIQLWEKVENQPSYKTNIMRLSGPMLGCMLQLALRAGEFSFACQLLSRIISNTPGAPPSLQSLRDFLQAAALLQDSDKAMACLEFAIDAGFPEAAILANEARDQLTFSTNQLSRLDSLLGVSSP